MEPTVWVPAAGAVLSALIVSGVALLIWAINTLLEMNERLSKLKEGQANLREGQTKLEAGQADLRQSMVKLEAGLTEIRGLLNQPRSAAGENP